MPLSDCKLIDLPKITDPRGNLSFVEGEIHIPFEIKRVYYLYDVPGGSVRGVHAHKNLQQFLISLSGSFDVFLDDGYSTCHFHLNRPSYGLYLCPMIWRTLDNFSSGGVCLALASACYDESEYVRDYNQFIKLAQEN